VRPVARQRLVGRGDGVRRRAGYCRRSEAAAAHREKALRDGTAANATGHAAARGLLLAGQPRHALVRRERCAQRLFVLRGAEPAKPGAAGAGGHPVLAMMRHLAVEAEAGRVARCEGLRQRGMAHAARRGGHLTLHAEVHRVAVRERVRFRRDRGDGVEPVPAEGGLRRDRVGLGLERLGLVPKVLAVALERAERAQPDAAIAHVDVPARLREREGRGC